MGQIIPKVKLQRTLDFCEFLINSVLNGEDVSFDNLIRIYKKERGNPFLEMKESTMRSHFSTLRYLHKSKTYRRTSILPHWFSTLWDSICFNRGLQNGGKENGTMETKSGKYFINSGVIFQCVGYCPHPSLIFENIKTGERQQWSVQSEIIKGFKELKEVQE